MNRKLFCIMVFGIFFLTGFAQLSATNVNGDQGIFEAELGRRGQDELILSMEGNYQDKDRLIVIRGIVTVGEKEGPFRGAFKGNIFVIRMPVRGKAITLIGRISFNENMFQGMWIGRPLNVKGWITGSFTPT